MRSTLILSLFLVACLRAQITPRPADIVVNVSGKPFTTFHIGADANKPFLAPLRSASGKIVTRGFPMENIPGETRDHLHHRGLWFSYDDVNGVKFWENDPSYTRGRMGKIRVRDLQLKQDGHSATLTATIDWNDPEGKTLLVENRKMVFDAHPTLRTIDFQITLTASTDVTLGDTKEGAFAIRLADNFTAKKGGKMFDADGRVGMMNIWGKRSSWVDYTAEIEGETLGVAIFDHPRNPRHPTYWHARDYGLFALNPFGRKAFDPTQEESLWKLPAGQKIELRWRVVIHPGDPQTARLADLYKEYAGR